MLYAMLASLSAYAPAPAVDPLPTSPPPAFAIVRLEKNDTLVTYQFVAKQVPYTYTEQVPVTTVVQGVAVTRLVEVQKQGMKAIYESVPVTTQVKGLQGYDTNGKPIARDRLVELLRKDAVVLIYKDGQKLDPAYLRIVRDNTVILVLPPADRAPEKTKAAPRP